MSDKPSSNPSLPLRRSSVPTSRRPYWANTWLLYAGGLNRLPRKVPRAVDVIEAQIPEVFDTRYYRVAEYPSFVDLSYTVDAALLDEFMGRVEIDLLPQLLPGSRTVRPLRIASLYESRLHETQRALQTAENETIIEEACGNRDLIAALMGDEWLGLRLLAQLRISKAASATSLRSSVRATLNSVAVGLAQLVRYGAADVEDGFFVITARGSNILTSIEKKSGVILKP